MEKYEKKYWKQWGLIGSNCSQDDLAFHAMKNVMGYYFGQYREIFWYSRRRIIAVAFGSSEANFPRCKCKKQGCDCTSQVSPRVGESA